jgi:2-iminobutanoate/2-iminopropanoate deaminase
MARNIIMADRAPQAIGPYSQAVEAGGFVFVSGQIPVDPGSSEVVRGTPARQTERALRNLEDVLISAGCALDDVVQVTLYVRDLSNFESINQEYAKFFPVSPPARACVQVSGLPRGVEVEVQAVAFRHFAQTPEKRST